MSEMLTNMTCLPHMPTKGADLNRVGNHLAFSAYFCSAVADFESRNMLDDKEGAYYGICN